MVMDSPHRQFAKDPLLAEYSFFGQMGVEQVLVSQLSLCKNPPGCSS